MNDHEVLNADQVLQWAAAHHPWEVGVGSDRLLRTFEFADFGAAMKFMAKVSPVADEMNHHPEWANVANKVTVELTTHDAGGITPNDLALAEAMSAAAAAV
ncbi:MAG: 4a-hydroxytetrahydrobiopterin dehydratase [Microthrixaceae bacterium]